MARFRPKIPLFLTHWSPLFSSMSIYLQLKTFACFKRACLFRRYVLESWLVYILTVSRCCQRAQTLLVVNNSWCLKLVVLVYKQRLLAFFNLFHYERFFRFGSQNHFRLVSWKRPWCVFISLMGSPGGGDLWNVNTWVLSKHEAESDGFVQFWNTGVWAENFVRVVRFGEASDVVFRFFHYAKLDFLIDHRALSLLYFLSYSLLQGWFVCWKYNLWRLIFCLF